MKLEETISLLKTMLPAQDFILTGSFVLAKYGLRTWDSVRDLDIILVKPEISTMELINKFMKEHPAPSTSKCTVLSIPDEEDEDTDIIKSLKEDEKKKRPVIDDEDEDDYDIHVRKKRMVTKVTKSKTLSIFMFDRVKIDIYIENDFNEVTLTVELENNMACKFTTIPHIIKAKQSYGRMKDWLQCRDMARKIFKAEEFNELLNTDWKSSLREDY